MDSCQSERRGATNFISAGSLATVTRASAGEQPSPLPISLSSSEYRGIDQVQSLGEHLVVRYALPCSRESFLFLPRSNTRLILHLFSFSPIGC